MNHMKRAGSLLWAPLFFAGCNATQSVSAPVAPAPQEALKTAEAKPVTTADAPALRFNGKMAPGVKISPVGLGWAKTSVNAVIFRVNSLVTWKDTQFIAYYDGDGKLALGKRKVGTSKWEVKTTQYEGNVKDAHNSISLGVDGKGIIHVSWDMHGNKLRYAQGNTPGGLELGPEMPMTGDKEASVTYPQFFGLPNGDLLFAYREGASGNGNMMLNRFDRATGKWSAVQHPMIDGEGKRNAYINQMAIDGKGGIHLSWCWRESPDVASNHDICYAYSPDQGVSWQKTTGEKYKLPITAASAEVALPVPQNSDLINQTSMTTDAANRPIIVSYWHSSNSNIPQFQVVWHDGQKWRHSQVGDRTQPFSLSGAGTKRIPISRPQVLAGAKGEIYVVFRDAERASDVSVAVSKDANHTQWETQDLYNGQEPLRGMVGVGTWSTQAEFKDIKVTQGQKTLFSSDFSKDLQGWKTKGGQWQVKDGVLVQSDPATDIRAMVGDPTWSDYTLSLKARKTSGQEGFLIVFGSPGDDTKSWWNLGGWGNTKFGLETPGLASQQVPGKIETGRWYDIRIELKGGKVDCYLDGKLTQSGSRVGAWEPSYDIELWKQKHQLNLFWQNVGQGDGEQLENIPPQPVGVLEWTP